MRKQQSGFTLIELIVVMVIVGLLGAVAVPKFLDLTKKAEAASVKNILGATRSALSIKVASELVNGTDIKTLAYNGSNPINAMDDLLSDKPEEYIGTTTSNPTTGDEGQWRDRTNGRWLMYTLKSADIITKADGTAGGGWSAGGTRNIINRIETVSVSATNTDVAGLVLNPDVYDYAWK